jgi:hypothetical protein
VTVDIFTTTVDGVHMEQHHSRFRVYRVVEAVPHINLFDVDSSNLYTTFQEGYTDQQSVVDALRTGDLVEATLAGNPADENEPWRIEDVRRLDGVRMSFTVDAVPPAVADELWGAGRDRPVSTPITDEGETPIGELFVQPREPLPNGAFVPNVVTGLIPMESLLSTVPAVGDPAVEALFVDPDPPDASQYSRPYGVALLFTEAEGPTVEQYRERYDIPTTGDTRPEFDPYTV